MGNVMPRPRKLKVIHGLPVPDNRAIYKPFNSPLEELASNTLTLVEYEAIRLIDAENKSQNDAAALMKISQPTISRILNSGRNKIADALVNGKAIRIEGGDFKFASPAYSCSNCKATFLSDDHDVTVKCPKCDSTNIIAFSTTGTTNANRTTS